ncbi:unnamed protein product [Absidia cylindrospora]
MSIENLSFQNLSLNPSSSTATPSITLTKESTQDLDVSDGASDDDNDFYAGTTTTTAPKSTQQPFLVNKPVAPSPSTSTGGKQHKKVTPLPSDDEDEAMTWPMTLKVKTPTKKN